MPKVKKIWKYLCKVAMLMLYEHETGGSRLSIEDEAPPWLLHSYLT